jgi:flagellar hook-associated protein 3 FlgL
MTRISTQMMYQRAVTAMLDQQSKVGNTQLQISSGKRILTPADDPAGAARVIDFTRAIATLDQYNNNANRATTRLTFEESALVGTENIFLRVKELAVQGSNDLLTVENRRAIAAEIRELRDGVLGLANTRDAQGEYIFAGYQTGTRPFNDAPGAVVYNGDVGNRQLQVSSMRKIADGNNGRDVFMEVDTAAGKRSMFDTLDRIADDLEAGLTVSGYLDDIDLALSHTLTVRATVGARMNAIDEQVAVNEDVKLVMETSLSDEQDVDIVEAITRYERQMTALQAAQQSYLKMTELSLFDFMR